MLREGDCYTLPQSHTLRLELRLATMRATQPLFKRLRRLALTTKQTNKGFYKGTGSGSMGRHTKHGDYKLEYHKVRTYKVPANLQDFKVRTTLQSFYLLGVG